MDKGQKGDQGLGQESTVLPGVSGAGRGHIYTRLALASASSNACDIQITKTHCVMEAASQHAGNTALVDRVPASRGWLSYFGYYVIGGVHPIQSARAREAGSL